MVKSLLFSLFMAIFASDADAQGIVKGFEADTIVPLSDTVAFIYIINTGDQQLVRCITYYQVRDVRDILIEFFNAMMYPSNIYRPQKGLNGASPRLKKT